MNEWVVSYDTEEALEEIKKIGFILFEPKFKELKVYCNPNILE